MSRRVRNPRWSSVASYAENKDMLGHNLTTTFGTSLFKKCLFTLTLNCPKLYFSENTNAGIEFQFIVVRNRKNETKHFVRRGGILIMQWLTMKMNYKNSKTLRWRRTFTSLVLFSTVDMIEPCLKISFLNTRSSHQ